MKFVEKLLRFIEEKSPIRTAKNHHVAVVFRYFNNTTIDILTFATNLPFKGAGSIHAEVAALDKLRCATRHDTIHLFVVRIANHTLQYSKPCRHCIEQMHRRTAQLHYKLGYVFYSVHDDLIEYTNSLHNDYISRFNRNRHKQ